MRLTATAVALLVGCLVVRAHCGDQPANLPVGVTVRVISVPISIGRRLVARLSRENESRAAFAELDQLTEAKKAELLHIAIAWADPGESGASASGVLVRYPIQDWMPDPGFGAPAPNPADVPPVPIIRWGAITPTGFESRSTGLDIQVRTIELLPNSQVTLGIVSRVTSFAGFKEVRGLTSPLGVTGFTVQPVFKQQAVYTTQRTQLDRDALLGTYVDESGDRIVIHTIRATIPPAIP